MSIFFSKPKNPVREPKKGIMPKLWASAIPFRRPGNFFEVFRAIWENRDKPRYAYRILQHGVCDGCALGTTGMKDWTVEGVHLCNIRLRLLRLNTMSALDVSKLADVAALKQLRGRDLRAMGRLPVPMIRHARESGFREISWDEALTHIVDKLRDTDPQRSYFYLTSRGIPNETYYAVQKAVRAMGTNNIDNAARICHSPSTFGLKSALGVAATTCSYSDLIGTDLIMFFGSNVANNQPVMMKYLYHAKKAGTKIVMVNPYREPGMEAYWIPSDLESAAFGTKISDEFFQVKAGGDIAFLHGVARIIIEENWYDADFITEHTAEFDTLRDYLQSLSWEKLERESGLSKARMHACATLIKNAEKAVFVWGMGITQHQCGENNVHAIINLALMKGFVGREGCGLMPIRGHSGVQGGAEMGAYASTLPGGLSINSENAEKLSEQYGFQVSDVPGLTTPEMLDAASRDEIDVLFAAGGNFKEVMPDPQGITGTLQKISLRVHMDIVLNPQMFIDSAETVILLPAMTRYEIPGGVTETSTERRVIFSPEIEGHRIEQARSEWDVVSEIAARLHPEHADKVRFENTAAIREEIGEIVSYYDGIQNLAKEGDSMQYGGARLCEGWNFPTDDGKAHFKAAPLPDYGLADDEFMLVTRRGKQFNSIIHEETDSLNHEKRDALLIHYTDAKRLNINNGDAVLLENTHGRYRGVASIVDVAPGTVQVYWPEGNTLLDPQARSPLAKIPAYKSVNVRLKKL